MFCDMCEQEVKEVVEVNGADCCRSCTKALGINFDEYDPWENVPLSMNPFVGMEER